MPDELEVEVDDGGFDDGVSVGINSETHEGSVSVKSGSGDSVF